MAAANLGDTEILVTLLNSGADKDAARSKSRAEFLSEQLPGLLPRCTASKSLDRTLQPRSHLGGFANKLPDQSINQFFNQSINHSIIQSFVHSIIHSFTHSLGGGQGRAPRERGGGGAHHQHHCARGGTDLRPSGTPPGLRKHWLAPACAPACASWAAARARAGCS